MGKYYYFLSQQHSLMPAPHCLNAILNDKADKKYMKKKS